MKRRRVLRKRSFGINSRFIKACVAVFLWILLVFFVLFIDPKLSGAVAVFFVLIFIFSVFFVSVLTDKMMQIFIYPFFIVLFFVLGYMGLGNFLNLFLVIGILVALELYLRPR